MWLIGKLCNVNNLKEKKVICISNVEQDLLNHSKGMKKKIFSVLRSMEN